MRRKREGLPGQAPLAHGGDEGVGGLLRSRAEPRFARQGSSREAVERLRRSHPRQHGGAVRHGGRELIVAALELVGEEIVELSESAWERLGQRLELVAGRGALRGIAGAQSQERPVLGEERGEGVRVHGGGARPGSTMPSMAADRHELEALRTQMDRLDAQLVELLHARAKAARRLAELRQDQLPALPVGERVSARRLAARTPGPLPEEAVRGILREVQAACLALEMPVKVACAGVEGGPCAAVARQRFGTFSQLTTLPQVGAAFDEVARRRAEFAVVPFETSSEGPVSATLTALVASELKVVEVLEAPVEIHLMNLTGNVADVEKVYATAADRAACQQALATAGLRAVVHDVRSPLFACQLAAEDPSAAAIAMEPAGAHLSLQIAARSLGDKSGDRLRFAVVGARPSTRTGEDYTTVAFIVHDTPGALLDVLKQFAERGVNLTKVDSRPVQGDGWSYLFLVELVGHPTDRPVIAALEEVRRLTRMLKVLGSYPRAVL